MSLLLGEELLQALEHLRLKKWVVSADGLPGVPVISGKCGLSGAETVWIEMIFTDAAGPHTLKATRSLTDAAAKVTFDGVAHTGEMPIRKHIVGFSLRAEVDVRVAGLPSYRFDATLAL